MDQGRKDVAYPEQHLHNNHRKLGSEVEVILI
jgi:hypothetical protein